MHAAPVLLLYSSFSRHLLQEYPVMDGSPALYGRLQKPVLGYRGVWL